MMKSTSPLTGADSLLKVEAERFGDDRSAFLDWLNQEVSKLLFGDLTAAKRLIQQIDQLRPRLQGKDRARVLRMLARFHHMTGQPGQALKLYQSAERIYQRLGDQMILAIIAKAKIDALMYLGRYRQALDLGHRTARFFRRRKRTMDQAQVLTNIGNVYHRLDDSVRALRCYDRARALMGDDAPANFLATVDYNRANILSNLNRLAEAEVLYRQAGQKYREANLEVAAEHCDYSLGYLEFLRARYASAHKSFEHVRERLEQLGDRRGKAIAELDIVEILLATNRLAEAQAMVAGLTKQFQQLKMNYELGKLLTYSAKAYMGVADYASAARMLSRARAIFSRENNKLWQTITIFRSAELAFIRGRPAQALPLARDSARRFGQLGDAIRQAYARILAAQVLLSQARAADARRALSTIARKNSLLPAAVLFPAYHLLGRISDQRGKVREAITAYQNALRYLRMLTGGVSADESRAIFLADKYAVFRDLSSALIKNGQLKAAFKVAEGARRQETDDYRADIPDTKRVSIPEKLQAKRDTQRAVLRKLYTPSSSGRRAAMGDVARVRKAENQLWQTEQQIHRFFHGYLPNQTRPTPALGDLVDRLGTATVLVGYVRLRDGWGAYVASHHGLEFVRLKIDDEQLIDLLRRMYFFLEKNAYSDSYRQHSDQTIKAGTNRYLELIARKIWHPLERHLSEFPRLVIVAHQQLRSVPFHALSTTSGEALYRHWRLEIADSAGSWSARGSRAMARPNPGVILVPGSSESTAEREETEAIMAAFPDSRLFCGAAVTRERLRAVVSEPARFVHVLSHASSSQANPFCSEILLDDGPFFGFDLFGVPVRAGLVTLSGCQTGRPGFFDELDTTTLADAFLSAGARTAIASLWPVSDEDSVKFMGKFYALWAQKSEIYGSWMQAIDYIKIDNSNPYHWAPFRLLGNLDY